MLVASTGRNRGVQAGGVDLPTRTGVDCDGDGEAELVDGFGVGVPLLRFSAQITIAIKDDHDDRGSDQTNDPWLVRAAIAASAAPQEGQKFAG